MHAINFSPVNNELFLVDAPTSEAAAAPTLMAQLRAFSWPSRAWLCSAKAPQSAAAVGGVLVEMIDALPLLARPAVGDADGAALSWVPTMAAWQAAARLALELTCRGRLTLRLSPCGRGGLQSAAWEARWQVYAETREERAALLRVAADFPAVVAIPDELGSGRGRRPMSAATSSLMTFLNGCADTLVREASRRGAMVRLKDCAASRWEQRLVRALGEDRARLFWDEEEAAELAAEVNAWAADEVSAPTLSFLPSPGRWSAAESLSSVRRRLILPAGRLAETLLGGHSAPRSLVGAGPLSLAA
jgi:hypothetical protein